MGSPPRQSVLGMSLLKKEEQHSASIFTTVSEYERKIEHIYHIIYWLYSHRQYCGVGYVLTEYLMGNLLSRLPEKERNGMIGFLESNTHMNLHLPTQEAVTEIVEKLLPEPFHSNIIGSIMQNNILPSLNFQKPKVPKTGANVMALSEATEKVPNAKCLSGKIVESVIGKNTDVANLIRGLINRMEKTAWYPMQQKKHIEKSHSEFAHYVITLELKEWEEKRDEIIKHAEKLYEGSHWLDMGMNRMDPFVKVLLENKHSMNVEVQFQFARVIIQKSYDEAYSTSLSLFWDLKSMEPVLSDLTHMFPSAIYSSLLHSTPKKN